MRIIDLNTIRSVLNPEMVVERIELALQQHAAGFVQSPSPGHLIFDSPKGDCHIKFGFNRKETRFVVKIATGFYENSSLGLPVNDGAIFVGSSKTGKLEYLLADQGWLTSWRTAAAGALAAKVLCPPNSNVIGVMGAGHQAELQLEWTAKLTGIKSGAVWARNKDKRAEFCLRMRKCGIEVMNCATAKELLHASNIVITATCSPTPLFAADDVCAGNHIVAMGADDPSKREIPTELYARAKIVATDDHNQCLHYSDFGHAVRQGIVAENIDVSLGSLLAQSLEINRNASDITIVDLTGLAAQDIALANLVCDSISDPNS